MQLDLPRHTEELIAELVQSRGFPSVEALIAAAVDAIAADGTYWDESLDAEDWAAIAEADADAERGDVFTSEQVRQALLWPSRPVR